MQQARAAERAQAAAARAQDAAARALATTQAAQGPRTRAELEALITQRGELREQVAELARRRHALEQRIGTADAAQVNSIRGEMREIDNRATALNTTISVLDDRIADAIGRGVLSEQGTPDAIHIPSITLPPPDAWIGKGVLAASLAGEALAFMLIGLAIWRFGMKRALSRLSLSVGDQTARLSQLQQSIDVIALEVERISEGQRYVTKVVADNALGEGQKAR